MTSASAALAELQWRQAVIAALALVIEIGLVIVRLGAVARLGREPGIVVAEDVPGAHLATTGRTMAAKTRQAAKASHA